MPLKTRTLLLATTLMIAALVAAGNPASAMSTKYLCESANADGKCQAAFTLYYHQGNGDGSGYGDGIVDQITGLDPEDIVDTVTGMEPGGYTTYSCLAWLCAYASAHQDRENVQGPDKPVTKLTAGGAISQGRWAGHADVVTSLGSDTCYYDPNAASNPSSGCGLTWSEVDWSCDSSIFSESSARDLVLYAWGPTATARDSSC
jgi:hypothetical protein